MHNPVCSAVGSPRKRAVTTNPDVFFPDEVVIDIISRLPAKTALRCRCVCRRWRDLTWTRHFLDLHLRRGVQMIIYEHSWSKLLLYENWWNHAKLMTWWEWDIARPMSHEFDIDPPPGMLFYDGCYDLVHHIDGIIVLREHSRSFILHNPIYGEYVRICFAKELIGCKIYGVFFHPSLNEYCTLWRIPSSVQRKPEEVDYRMLNLGPNPCWRRIRNPWNDNAVIGYPLYLDGYLYWMVEQSDHFEIVEFDIKTELFTQIPHTVPETVKWQKLVKRKIHGLFSLVLVSSTEKTVHVNVWTLHDRAGKSWKNSTYNISLEVSPEPELLVPVAVWDGELFLKVDGNQFVCNLKTGTATMTTVFTQYAKKEENKLFLFCYPHAMSLDSLRNCRSNIFMNKDGLKPGRVATNSFIPRYVLSSDDSDDEGSFPGTKKSLLEETKEEDNEEETSSA